MCLNNCCKKQYEPRKKKNGPYERTNAFSSPPACEQIVTLLLFLVQLALHSVFVVPPMDDISHAILWVLLGLHYSLFLIIAYDYFYLSFTDPADPLIIDDELSTRYRPEQLSFCLICDKNVHVNSHHCYRCNRCTADFDHHCKFLNNCIGGRNYQSFFRLLSVYALYNIGVIAQGIWVFIRVNGQQSFAFTGSQWGTLVLIIMTFLILILQGGLLLFHCYISLCQMTTTLAFNHPQMKKSPQSKMETPKININIFEAAPESANRISDHRRV